MANGFAGTGRGAALDLGGGVYATRADMEDWRGEKKRADARWVKTGAVAAIVAAVLAFLGWAFPIDTVLLVVGRVFSLK